MSSEQRAATGAGTVTTAGDRVMFGDSEAAAVIRAKDWSATELGPMQQWPEALITSLNMMLSAKIPMQIFWGPRMICFYNDPLLPVMSGKHPWAIGKPAIEVWAEAWEIVGQQLEAVMQTGESLIFHNTLVPLMRNGVMEDMYWDYSYSPLVDASGTIVGLLDIAQETTQAVMAQRKLIETEKLTAVGRLAASIAHEINNPLESVTNLLYIARNTPEQEEVPELLELADRELRRVAAISRQTLRFYRQSNGAARVTLQELLESVLLVYQGRFVNSNVQVRVRMRSHNAVECREGEIRQVLSNLVSNAVDAMPKGGKLLLRSRDGVNAKTGAAGVFLTVADSGAGMPGEVIGRLFEAFFTTKGIGGSGLGMFISKEIVDMHHGEMQIRSSQRDGSSGTVFRLFLPLVAALR